jgi:phosphomannomutase
VNPDIFRLYDIRGVYPQDLNAEVAYNIGCYFGKICSGGEVNIAFDGRLSSPELYNALAQGLLENNIKLASLGLVPSPVLYFADNMFAPKASIIVTASHNPKDHNGFKMMMDGESFFGDQIVSLKEYVYNSSKKYIPNPDILADIVDLSLVKELYLSRLVDDIKIDSSLKIVWDTGNAACGEIVEKLFEILPNKNILINGNIDGNFPNHHPDPADTKNLGMLIKEVLHQKADLGIAFDGDGDRVGFISGDGKILSSDHMLCLFSEDVLQKNPGSLIMGDVRSSKIFFDYITANGGKWKMTPAGHSFIKAEIKKTGALFAGEQSMHTFFSDRYFGFDDAIYAALRMMEILSKKQKSLDDIILNLPDMPIIKEIKIPMDSEKKFSTVKNAMKYMEELGRDFISIDGIRYQSEDGWWLIRPSNTEDKLVIRIEAKSEEDLELVENDMNNILRVIIT